MFYKEEKTKVKKVFLTSSNAISAGALVCYDRDNTAGTDVDGTALDATSSSYSRGLYVEFPVTGNLHNFAGVATQAYDAVTGGQWIDIYEPCGGMLDVLTDQSCSTGTTWITCQVSTTGVAGGIGEGPIIGLARQTIDRSSTSGLAQIEAWPIDPRNKPYGLAVPSSTANNFSPAIWETCPINEIRANPSLGYELFDDFVQVGATTAPWEIVGTNGTFTGLAGTAGGIGRLAVPGTDNDECYVASSNDAAGLVKLSTAGKRMWFEARVKPSSVTVEHGIFVGLGEEKAIAADFMTDNTMALKVVDAIGFQVVAAAGADAAKLDTIVQLNGGALAQVKDTAATLTAAWTNLGMVYDGGTMTFYVNGVALADTIASTGTNFPLDQVLEVVFALKAGSGAAQYLDVDWVRVVQLR